MERVVVTHEWMGMRFEQMLRAAPDGLLQLFAPTTSILIGSEVRPSIYTGRTGGIQLDSDYFWLTSRPTLAIRIRRGLPMQHSREPSDAERHAMQFEREGRVH